MLFDGMVSDVRTKLEPALAAQQGLSQAEGEAAFATSFPTLANFATTWQQSTSAKSHALSDSQVALGPTFANADRIPLQPIPWMFIVPGFVIAVFAGASLVPARRSVRAAAPINSADAPITVSRTNASGAPRWSGRAARLSSPVRWRARARRGDAGMPTARSRGTMRDESRWSAAPARRGRGRRPVRAA
jgi:hypothetical protein